MPTHSSSATVFDGGAPIPGRLRSSRLSQLVLLCAAVLLIVAWSAVAAVLVLKRQDALAAELRQNTNLALALEEQTARVVATVDQATLRVRDAVANGQYLPADLVRYANETGLAPAILVQLSFIDSRGRLVASNLDPDGSRSEAIDLSSRAHVRVHLAPDGLPAQERLKRPDDLYIGKPVLGKVSGRWTIQISRRVQAGDGRASGVVVASLDPAYFEDVFRKISLGNQGAVSLVGRDLNIRARVVGGKSVGMASDLPAASAFSEYVTGVEGHYAHESAVDGVSRLNAYRQVAGYPLYLLVATSQTEALADWSATSKVMVLLTVLLSVVVACGAASFSISLRRIERSSEALRLSESRANAANNAKTEFLAAMSHELRTPLTSIRGFAELMEFGLEDPEYREQAGFIRKGAEHLNELLTEILDLVKVESGAMTIVEQDIDVTQALMSTRDLFAVSAAKKGLALTVSIEAELPPVRADRQRLNQILNNLSSNAIKFTDSGAVTLAARQEGPWICIVVKDTGPGIPVHLQEVIFERFRQADAQVSHQHGGTGLGLSLARSFAELMGGTLTVDSSPGGGASFVLKLRPAQSRDTTRDEPALKHEPA